jgi:homogentisate 1,2-dioxygenase
MAAKRSSRGRAKKPLALRYQTGFGNEHESEALEGALPVGRRSPQRVAYGLYAEQLSGSAFTAPRASNQRSWVYRIRPSVQRGRLTPIDSGWLRSAPVTEVPTPAAQLRWDPLPVPRTPRDWVDGLMTLATNGSVRLQTGMAVHVYLANRSMRERFFYNADGELLVVPQQGRLQIHTELGVLEVAPGEIVLLPRGMVFRVELPDGPSRGYVCENYGQPLRLPERSSP